MFLSGSDFPVKAEMIPVDLQRRIAELEEELKEERRLNRDLTRRLLDDSAEKEKVCFIEKMRS